MTNRIKNADLPFINLSKENLILIYDSLEAEQAGKMLFALTDYIYKGIEPTFESKIEKGVWNNIMLLIDRKAESYFKKAEVARENGKKGGRPKKETINNTEVEFEKDRYCQASYEFIEENEEFLNDRVNAIVYGKLDPYNEDKQMWLKQAYSDIKQQLFNKGYTQNTREYKEITGYLKDKIDIEMNKSIIYS